MTEAVSNPTIRISTEFYRILGNTIENFLKLTDDPDSDVRMTAEECLNRIIRVSFFFNCKILKKLLAPF